MQERLLLEKLHPAETQQFVLENHCIDKVVFADVYCWWIDLLCSDKFHFKSAKT